ncbi:MAG: hypothetical protein ACREQA_17710 [Candidatus Binatia bacterium]
MTNQSSEELWRYFDFSEETLFPLVAPKPPWDERRPTGELVKELFDLRRVLPREKPLPEPQDEAQAYLIGKLKDARAAVAQLQEEGLARAQLHDESTREIDYQISRAALSLDQFTGIGISQYAGIEIRRAHLERQLANFRRDRRSTFLKTWEDIGKLRKEFREAVVEYKSLLSRLGLL